MTPVTPVADAPEVLSAMLKRYRRRQRLVTVTSNGLVAAVVVAATAVPLFLLVPVPIAIRFGMLSACAGLIGAAALAIVRTPPLGGIAAMADARLALDDRLVTALQFIDDPDVVSRLIVRDAAVRAADVSPAEVFPFHAPARIAWIGAATLAASAMLTVMATRQSAIELSPADAVPRMQNPGVSAKASGNVPTPAGNAVAVPSTGGRTAPPSVPERPRDRDGTAGAEQSDRTDASKHVTGAAPADTRGGQGDRPMDVRLPPIAPRPSTDGLASRVPGSTTSKDLGSAGGSGSRGRSLSGAAGGISANQGRAQVGSGGAPRTRDAIGPSAASREYEARYRESIGRAEAALANERIPPGLRAYVKAYFTAINPR